MIFTEKTIGEMVHGIAVRFKDKECLVSPSRGTRYSFAELDRLVDDMAAALLKIGVKKDCKVGILSQNSPEWLITMFAAQRIGGVVVTINNLLKQPEIEYVLKQADVHTLFIAEDFKGVDYVEMIRTLVPEAAEKKAGGWKSKKFNSLKNIVTFGSKAHDGMLCSSNLFKEGAESDKAGVVSAEKDVKCRDIAALQFTSGTTGYPKGVMLTHYGIVNNALSIAENMNYTPEDRFCNCLPLFHGSSCFTATMMTLFSGATLVLLDYYHPKLVLSAIQNEKCTISAGVPTMFINELAQPDFESYDLSTLNRAIMFGSVCPPKAMKQVMDKMGCLILSIYGSTELSPCTCMTLPSDPLEARLNSIGKAIAGTEQVVIDPLSGEPCSPGVKGELLCRGYNVMKGYYKDPGATARAIDDDGFYHTGDAVIEDENGNYHVIGRVNDMIIHGGDNIYPSEVENVIYQMPEVGSVEVLGLPSPTYGEQVAAFIIMKKGFSLTKQDVVRFCKDKIATYKIPKYIFFVDAYPLTASGKVQKSRLRKLGESFLASHGIEVK